MRPFLRTGAGPRAWGEGAAGGGVGTLSLCETVQEGPGKQRFLSRGHTQNGGCGGQRM